MRFDRKLYERQSHYTCQKGTVECPNSYVKKACYMLDGDQTVVRFRFRVVRYQFFHPELETIRANAFDFLVETKKGKKLVQTMPLAFLKHEVGIARLEAMQMRAKDLNLPLEIWTETELFGTNEEYRMSIIVMLC